MEDACCVSISQWSSSFTTKFPLKNQYSFSPTPLKVLFGGLAIFSGYPANFVGSWYPPRVPHISRTLVFHGKWEKMAILGCLIGVCLLSSQAPTVAWYFQGICKEVFIHIIQRGRRQTQDGPVRVQPDQPEDLLMIIVGTQLVNVTFFSGKAPAAHPGSSTPEDLAPANCLPCLSVHNWSPYAQHSASKNFLRNSILTQTLPHFLSVGPSMGSCLPCLRVWAGNSCRMAHWGFMRH